MQRELALERIQAVNAYIRSDVEEFQEEWVEQRQAMGDDLDAFIALTKKYVEIPVLAEPMVAESTLGR